MRRALGSILLSVVAAIATASCTLVSGVDDLEVRRNGQTSSRIGDASDPTDPADGATDAGRPSTGGGGAGGACSALGTWTACVVLQPFTTCDSYCRSIGKGCVDNCCASDDLGPFPAKVGQAYAAGPTCSGDALPSTSSFGLCADPLLFGSDSLQARCCCR